MSGPDIQAEITSERALLYPVVLHAGLTDRSPVPWFYSQPHCLKYEHRPGTRDRIQRLGQRRVRESQDFFYKSGRGYILGLCTTGSSSEL